MGAVRRFAPAVAVAGLVASACAGSSSAGPDASTGSTTATISTTTPPPPAPNATLPMEHGGEVDAELLRSAYLGAAPFQDVAVAESAGWVSTIDTLGCFEHEEHGGMGVHWLNESLLDAELDAASPEALVYELDAAGDVAGLVAHEYLVPVDVWTSDDPPHLFGLDFHEHPTLPFWVLHASLWKDNPTGMFSDWNPAVRMCPASVAVFGADPPTSQPTGGNRRLRSALSLEDEERSAGCCRHRSSATRSGRS